MAVPFKVSFSVANGVGAFGPFQSKLEAMIASVKSAFGSQSVVLKNCNLDKVVLARLDVAEDFLDEELSFTFDDAELLTSFTEAE